MNNPQGTSSIAKHRNNEDDKEDNRVINLENTEKTLPKYMDLNGCEKTNTSVHLCGLMLTI